LPLFLKFGIVPSVGTILFFILFMYLLILVRERRSSHDIFLIVCFFFFLATVILITMSIVLRIQLQMVSLCNVIFSLLRLTERKMIIL
jgi:hypothetical protein